VYTKYIWKIFPNTTDSSKNVKKAFLHEFGLSFNIIREVFLCYGQEVFFVGLMNFLKNLGYEQKKNH
jgi:hypothetical protein